ncbi:MAG: aquaporin [Actinomycetota bacterium]
MQGPTGELGVADSGRSPAPVPRGGPLAVGEYPGPRSGPWEQDFHDVSHEGRRLFAELFGTFLLVLAGAGASVVSVAAQEKVGRGAEVTAPALTVLAVILFMGAISGAHLNPAVSVAFALRREFPWRRVPGYIAVQVLGAVLACCFLWITFGQVGHLGALKRGAGISQLQAIATEAVLTLGLVSTILGTASGAQNVGPLSAVAVAGYIVLAGLWSGPVSGAAMNPARFLGPAIALGDFHNAWVYLAGPAIGMVAAIGVAHVLRGPGGDPKAAQAAQGSP